MRVAMLAILMLYSARLGLGLARGAAIYRVGIYRSGPGHTLPRRVRVRVLVPAEDKRGRGTEGRP